MNGRFISVSCAIDSSHLALSAASLTLCGAILSLVKSIPVSDLNSAIIHLTSWVSRSSPPRLVSPRVDLTSNTPLITLRTLTSNVPPPKSYTTIRFVPSGSRKARAAAVGSFKILFTLKPAILPAALVACR